MRRSGLCPNTEAKWYAPLRKVLLFSRDAYGSACAGRGADSEAHPLKDAFDAIPLLARGLKVAAREAGRYDLRLAYARG